MDPLIGMTINFIPTASNKKDEEAPRGGLGSQVLPVADLGEDFSRDPEDGMEYLFLVRREAELQPRVNRVINPYTTSDIIPTDAMVEEPMSRPTELWREAFVQRFTILRERMTLAPSKTSYPPSNHKALPISARDEGAWSVFIHGKKVAQMKPGKVDKGKAVETGDIEMETSANEAVTMSLEDAKAAALASLELDAPPPPPSSLNSITLPSIPLPSVPPPVQFDAKHPPHTPTTSILNEIDKPSIIHILSHFTTWLAERSERHEAIIQFVPSTVFAPMAVRRKATTSTIVKPQSTPTPTPPKKLPPRAPLPTSLETDWILSLLARLESLLNGDDIATLRDLARMLSTLAEASGKQSEKRDLRGRSQEQKDLDEAEAEGRAKSWMIIAVIAGCWGQQDMWQRSLAW